MSKWKMVKLKEVCKFVNGDRGKNYPSANDFVNDGVPFINAGHLNNNSISFDNMNYISRDKYNQLGSGKIQNGDFIYCLRGSIGKHAIVKNSDYGAIASSLVILRPLNIDVTYLSYCMDSPDVLKQQSKANNGSSQPNLSATSVKEYNIPFPSLDEQHEIAATLDAVSDLLKLRKQKLAELDKLIESVFYDMFGDPVTNEKGWNKKLLKEVCDVRDGTHDSPKYVEKGYPLITSKNLSSGKLDFGSVNLISQADFDSINKRSNVDSGDILMPMIGTIGNPIIVDTNKKFAIKNVALLKFSNSQFSNIFVKVLLSSEFFDVMTKRSNRGGTQKFIALSDIRNLNIPAPPLSLQNRFASIVQKIEQQKTLVQQSIDETQELFDSLMSKYFDE